MDQLMANAAEETKRVMAGVTPSQFENPTPCSEFNVKELANHMAGLAMGAERAANKQERVAPPDPMPDLLGENPGAAYAPMVDKAVAAWGQPGALEGNTEFGPGEMPAQMAGAITLMEIAVHGWDLAAATGQKYTMEPEVASAVHETVRQLANEESRQRGVFGQEVKVSDNATEQDRLLGYAGRDPNWSA